MNKFEFSDQGGEVSYNHMNNVVADDEFKKINSKWMAQSKKKQKSMNIDKLFGKKMNFSEYYDSREKMNEKVLGIIKYGNNIKNSENFWNNFINICGNSSALSELLEVPKEKIIKWTKKINDLKKITDEERNIRKNSKII